jgi:glycosyltransferase involved in cell wall biosynthesis
MGHGSPRILHLISSLGVGGAERLLVDFVTSLSPDEAAAVTVVVMNEADPTLLDALQRTRARIFALGRPRGSRDPRYAARLLSLVKAEDIALVHAHNPGSKRWAMLLKLARPGMRLVFTVHATNVASRYGARERSLHNLLVNRTIAISRAVEAECRASGLRQVVLIRNGIDTARFRIEPEPEMCRLEREPHRIPVLTSVARLVHRIKGQDVLIEAAAKLKQKGIAVHVRLVGSPSRDQPETPQVLTDLVARRGLGESVQILSGIADAAAAIKESDVVVLPSRFEGLGLVLLEAMAASVPVVASDLEGPGELVAHGQTGYLAEPGNAFDLADKIELLLRDRSRASAMMREARQVAARHDIAVMRDAYLSLYRELVGGH